MVLAVHQDSFRHWHTDKLFNHSQLSIINNNILMFFEVSFIIEESNIYGLLSKDLIAILTETLSDSESCNDTFIVFILVLNFVRSFGSKPLVSPHL